MKKKWESYYVILDGVRFKSHDMSFDGSCPECQIGIPECITCGGFGEVWTNDPRSFPLDELKRLRLLDLQGLEQDE